MGAVHDRVSRFPVQGWRRYDCLLFFITEISCVSKISCLAFNPYIKSQLLSSDYEGVYFFLPLISHRRRYSLGLYARCANLAVRGA